MTAPKPVVLCILDGWGINPDTSANAPALADTPNFDRIMSTRPHARLVTHGNDVGLPKGQMGNSEVGHTNIGAGRIVAMDLGMIDLAIEDGSFFERPALVDFISAVKEAGGTAHLLGIISDGGVHGHTRHAIAAAQAVSAAGVPVVVHALTDGRDVPPRSANGYLQELEDGLPDNARIATVNGRYYAMDRDNRWDRVEKAYDCIVGGQGRNAATPEEAVETSYAEDATDEFIVPTVIGDYGGARDGDGLFCLNFRADRAREILRAIGQPGFDAFDRTDRPQLSALLGMVDYSSEHDTFMTTVFPKRKIENT